MFQYVLVDEFQDTNVVQAAIVERLSRSHRNILVVGDDAQSIYSFRGAEIKNILNFPKTYPQARTFRLTTNYRSTPQILAVANAVIGHNTEQFKKELSAVRASGNLPSIVPARTGFQEADYISEQIVELQNQGYPLNEIAVLFRAAFHAQNLEFEMMKRNIPYEFRGGLKFFERSHVKDIIAHLRLIHNVRDAMAWVRILRIHPGIGIVTAGKIANEAGRYVDVHEALSLAKVTGKKAQVGWQGVTRVLSAVLGARDFPSAYIRAVASSDDYALYLENEFPNYQERLEDLEQFAVFAEQFDELSTFLDAVSLTNEFGAERGDDDVLGDRVILSTIHQAKGLEWDAVFVINLADGKFPHSRSYESPDELEEERRLFYVASTRARKELFLTYPTTAGYEHIELQQPSMFLGEIPKDAVEMVKLTRPRFSRGGSTASESPSRKSGEWEEPSIVLNDSGETISRPAPSSFLKDIDEL
jgi:DNA helicase-2/ATP-dependent DNA helicase PcrA